MILVGILLLLFSFLFAPQQTINLQPQRKDAIETLNFDINEYSLQALNDNDISKYPCYFLMNKETNWIGQQLQDKNGLDNGYMAQINYAPENGAYYKMQVDFDFRGNLTVQSTAQRYVNGTTRIFIFNLNVEYTSATQPQSRTVTVSDFENEGKNILVIFNLTCNAPLYKHPTLTGWHTYQYPNVGVLKPNNENYQLGYNQGKQDGLTEGYKNGYTNGKTDGINEGEQNAANAQNGFLTIFGSIASVPITILNGLNTFNILDTPIISILMTLLILVIILWLVKRFI